MADADAKPPPESAADAASQIASASPTSASAGDADAAIEKQLADLDLAGASSGAGGDFPEPSGWEDGLVLESAGGDEIAGDQQQQQQQQPADTAAAAADAKIRFPRRPGEPDCTYYVKFGTCRFGVKCKFNHPSRKKKSRVKGSGSSGSVSNSSSSNKASSPDDDQAPREEYEGLVPDISDAMGFDEKGSASNSENLRKISYQVIDLKKGMMEPKEKIAEDPEKGIYFKKLDETNVTNQKVRNYALTICDNHLVIQSTQRAYNLYLKCRAKLLSTI